MPLCAPDMKDAVNLSASPHANEGWPELVAGR